VLNQLHSVLIFEKDSIRETHLTAFEFVFNFGWRQKVLHKDEEITSK
jgi:hypothetical protein